MNAIASTAPASPVLTIALAEEPDVVLARRRAREIAQLIGFDGTDQVRFATAVSELARNAFEYARGGRVSFSVERDDAHSLLVALVQDKGPGIANVQHILQGSYRSRTGMGVGIAGARRLCDRFDIDSSPEGGTKVSVAKVIAHAPPLASADVAALAKALSTSEASTPWDELQRQNQELVLALDALRERNDEIERLSQELSETNRGVVALYAELDERADALSRMSETKTRFLSDMSHELRTPLTSIINLSGLLLAHVDGPLAEEQRTQVTLMRQSAESLAEMVNDLLDIAKIEAGAGELRIERFGVNTLFASLRGMFRPLVIGSVTLRFTEPEPAITLDTDEQRVAQVLRNFVSNALKFTPHGEVSVRATLEPGDEVRFTVSDTGIGLGVADQERIFEDYAQVDGPIQRRVRGTGLGLPLTRKLARLLGGRVEMRSVEGEGSHFSLVVPRQARPNA